MDLNVGSIARVCRCEVGGQVYTLRPGISGTSQRNHNWGGVGTDTCNAPTQTMTVTINASIDIDVDIDIDIKPGSFPNSINLGSGGATPVAILGSDTFDVLDIDESTLTLGTAGLKTVGKKDPRILCSIEDVSGDFSGGPEGIPDGFDDLVCHFITAEITDESGDTEATISRTLLDGTPIEGSDSVNIVPAP